ncbi:hypothetical protein [Kocuria sp. NPDC057446]|uniref:hypothetical protein n=1 Tax=Kocuria sp. NPDC057446 TaxID=3346137 RepID=UPI00368F1B33
METRNKSALGAVIGGALLAGGLGVGPAIAAPPEPYTDTRYAECPGDLDVRIDAVGKGKFFEVPGLDQVIAISPNTTVTITDTGDESNSVTYKANGAFHIEFLENETVVRATGVNVLTTEDPGVFLTRGNVTFVNDATGEKVRFEGPGKVTDICAILAN